MHITTELIIFLGLSVRERFYFFVAVVYMGGMCVFYVTFRLICVMFTIFCLLRVGSAIANRVPVLWPNASRSGVNFQPLAKIF
jgi:hypothetical protein